MFYPDVIGEGGDSGERDDGPLKVPIELLAVREGKVGGGRAEGVKEWRCRKVGGGNRERRE